MKKPNSVLVYAVIKPAFGARKMSPKQLLDWLDSILENGYKNLPEQTAACVAELAHRYAVMVMKQKQHKDVA